MADATMPQQGYAAPAAVVHDDKEQYIQQTPLWVVIVRVLQIVFSFVTVVMAGVLIHGHAMGANGFAVVCVSAATRPHHAPPPLRLGQPTF
jgi:hypothetical protein